MGLECAQAFHDCPIDHWSNKKQHTVEEKCCLVLEYTEEICQATVPLISRMSRTHKLNMMKILLQNLHFINGWFKEFNEKYAGKIWVKENIKYRRHKYFPLLLESYQHDCRALLSDIKAFVIAVEPYLTISRNVVALNKFIRWVHTVLFYLQFVKKKNPALHDKPPQNIKQVPNPYPEEYYILEED